MAKRYARTGGERALDLKLERAAAIKECAACVPSNWLDPLLTGPNKVAEFPACPPVEKLLNAIRDRILALNIHERQEPK